MSDENIYKHPVAQRFFCTKCGLCCRDTSERKRNILLLEKETAEIALAISKPISTFAKSKRGAAPYIYEMKKTDKNGACVFLQNCKCLIYPFRPLVCRFYPFELKRMNNLEYEFFGTKECPGTSKGKVLKKEYYAELFRIAQARLGSDQSKKRRSRKKSQAA